MIKEQNFVKKDTSINWAKAKNFIPKENEIIVYIDTNSLKMGDGKTPVNDLPFLSMYSYNINNNTLEIQKKE